VTRRLPTAQGEANDQTVASTAKTPSIPLKGSVCNRAGTCVRGIRRKLTRADLGEAWPFTTDDVVLVCVREIGPLGQIFVVEGAVQIVANIVARLLEYRGHHARASTADTTNRNRTMHSRSAPVLDHFL